ncbi:BolA family protein [Gilvimarinus sp. F26214L]|uniref:BolA family protein n=1 Tax=Gilvimarinus sp. DZF01 TaxID=3461371 RepID=UPI00404615B9
MSIQERIQATLASELQPSHLKVENESHMHNVPANSETHFKVVVVSPEFAGKRLVQRHQRVYQLLQEELAGPVHALALHTYAPDEWQDGAQVTPSPDCMGGKAREE